MIFGSMCAKWMSSLDSGLWLNIQCHYEILTTSSVDISCSYNADITKSSNQDITGLINNIIITGSAFLYCNE